MKSTPTPGVTELIRDAAGNFGDLVGGHLKVARLEMASDLRSLGKRVGVLAMFAACILIGYTLALAGAASYIGGATTTGTPLMTIGLIHVVLGAIGVFLNGR